MRGKGVEGEGVGVRCWGWRKADTAVALIWNLKTVTVNKNR